MRAVQSYKKHFIKIIVLCLVILLDINLKGEAAMNEAFLYSTVLISYKNAQGSVLSGTGFLVSKEIKNGTGHVFLITNKHVIPPEGEKKFISLRMNIKKGNEPPVVELIQIPIVGDNKQFLPYVKVHPDKDTDVAAINITNFINQHNIQGAWLPELIFGTEDKLKTENITIGDEIFLLGYPDAIYDPRNTFPLLRQGIIATVPYEGYAFNDALRKKYKLPDKINGFLIDANVFPGSSGSLVILKPQSTTIGPQGQTVVSSAKKRPYLLGLVSMSIPIVDVNLRSVQRMGLGVVYSIETIQETIAEFYK